MKIPHDIPYSRKPVKQVQRARERAGQNSTQ